MCRHRLPQGTHSRLLEDWLNMGRPVADSPEYVGDLFYIYVPLKPHLANSPWVLHRVSTNEETHEAHISAMLSHGVELYRTEKETFPSQV